MKWLIILFIPAVTCRGSGGVARCHYCVPENATTDCYDPKNFRPMDCPIKYNFACTIIDTEFTQGLRGCASRITCQNDNHRKTHNMLCCDTDDCNTLPRITTPSPNSDIHEPTSAQQAFIITGALMGAALLVVCGCAFVRCCQYHSFRKKRDAQNDC